MYVFGEQLDMFFDTLNSIVTSRGGDLATNQRRFSTKFWDQIYDYYIEPEEGGEEDGPNAGSVISATLLSYLVTLLVLLK